MRDVPSWWWDLWNSGGPFVGDSKPCTRVTVDASQLEEPDYEFLHVSPAGQNIGSYNKVPIRWFQRCDNSQLETEIPTIRDVTIDRNVGTDAATCDINLYNQHMLPLTGVDPGDELGQPGFYTWGRGTSDDEVARWKHHEPNGWYNVLTPNALVRCVDTETEIMTRRGWLWWDEVHVGDETLGVNPETGLSEWQIIEEVFQTPYKGVMVEMRTRVHDSLTTENHRWLLRKKDGAFEWKTTETLNTRSRIPLSADHVNTNVAVYSDDFVELAAWYYTEGSAEHRLRSMDWGGSITQSKQVNPDNVIRIRNLFNRLYGEPGMVPRGKYVSQDKVDEAIRLRHLGLTCRTVAEKVGVSEESVRRWGLGLRQQPKKYKWCERAQSPGIQCFTFTQEVARSVRKVVVGPDKVPTFEFLGALTQEQLELFIEVSVLADGNNDRGSLSFKQAVLDRTKAFEYACVLAGKSVHTTTVRGGWETTLLSSDVCIPVSAVNQQKQHSGVAAYNQISYDGIVWCPRVEHGNWLARRNGCIYLTGNTYQGFGGHDKEIPQALGDGNIILTGIWLIDQVQVKTDGTIALKCRDMAKLVIDQNLYPPLIPQSQYPMERYRWKDITVVKDSLINVREIGKEEGLTRFGAYPSGNYYWFANGCSHGHCVSAAFDQNDRTFWMSTTNGRPDAPYAVEYIEFAIDGVDINKIFVHAFLGNYRMYVSLWKDGAWVPGAGPIGYNPGPGGMGGLGPGGSIGRYDGVIHAPYVFMTGVPFEGGGWFCLPQVYTGVDKVRLTFDQLAFAGHCDVDETLMYHYVAGVRDLGAGCHESYKATVDGNFKDYADIVKDILLWAGFWCYDPDFSKDPEVYGNIEMTGLPGPDPQHMFTPPWALPYDWFDRKALIDIIKQFTAVTGYLFWVDDEGAARFEAPNIWRWPSNFTNTGERISFTPVIDERHQLISYGVQTDDKTIFGEIIFANIDVYDKTFSTEGPATVSAVFKNPMAGPILKGLVRTEFNEVPHETMTLTSKKAMEAAMLKAVREFLAARQGQVECIANPAIGINDQVRIFERQTSETYIHYVRGVQTHHDLDSGEFRMTLTTHWMGDELSGYLTPDNLEPILQEYFESSQGKTTTLARLDNYFRHPTTIYAPTGEQPPPIP